MKCIGISPVWSWAIAEGIKTVENRKSRTSHRGPLAIYSTKNMAVDEALRSRDQISKLGYIVPETLPTGVVVCVVDLCASVPYADRMLARLDYPQLDGPFANGPHCWMLASVRRVEPFTVRGMPGMFAIEMDDAINDG